METVFPQFVRCTLPGFWQSGSRNDYEMFCILTCNVLHRYVFLVLWYYFVLLLVLSLGDFSYLVMKWLIPNVRAASHMFPGVNDGEGIHTLCDKLRFADWLFLQCVRRQIDTVNFKKVIEKLIEHYSEIEEDSDDENWGLFKAMRAIHHDWIQVIIHCQYFCTTFLFFISYFLVMLKNLQIIYFSSCFLKVPI